MSKAPLPQIGDEYEVDRLARVNAQVRVVLAEMEKGG